MYTRFCKMNFTSSKIQINFATSHIQDDRLVEIQSRLPLYESVKKMCPSIHSERTDCQVRC